MTRKRVYFDEQLPEVVEALSQEVEELKKELVRVMAENSSLEEEAGRLEDENQELIGDLLDMAQEARVLIDKHNPDYFSEWRGLIDCTEAWEDSQ